MLVRSVLIPVLFCLAGTILFWAYSPGLNGPFVFDDIPNIIENANVQIDHLTFRALLDASFSTHTGPLSRPVSMLSFALSYYSGGMDAFGFKLTNLVIHYFNAFLIFMLCRQVLERLAIPGNSIIGAATAAALWLLHPYNVTSVLYVVQRMVELAALFGVLAIYCYFRARVTTISLSALAWLTGCLISSMLAVMSKENMIILIPLLAFIEWSIFKFAAISSCQVPVVRSLKFVMLGGVLLFVGLFAYKFPEFQRGYDFRSFSMNERILTQGRVFWMYVGQVCVPNIYAMHLFHDEIVLSRSWNEPLSTASSALGMGVWVGCVVFFRKKIAILAFGLGWFAIGHLVESTIVPLELMHDHRNYFPAIGLTMLAGGALQSVAQKKRALVIVVLITCLGVFSVATHHRATDWSSWETLVVTEAEKNPRSSRSQYEAGRYYYWRILEKGRDQYRHEDYDKARAYFEQGYQSSESSLVELAALLRLNDFLGVAPEPVWINDFLARTSTTKINPNDLAKMLDLYKCRINGDCKVDAAFLVEVAGKAARNDLLPSSTKASLLAAAATLALKEGHMDFGLYYVLQAIDLEPAEFEYFRLATTIALITKNKELLNDLMVSSGRRFVQEDQIKWLNDIATKISE